MNAYFTIYQDIISGGGRFTPDELSDVIDYYVSSDDLLSGLDSLGTKSGEQMGEILRKAGVDFQAGDYCYMAYSVDRELCCVDATSSPGECYLASACQGGRCMDNSGGGCYMALSAAGETCCVDYTLPIGYCYPGSVCGGDVCVEQPGPGPMPTPAQTPAPAPGCSVFTCGDGICECYFPYNPVYDEAEPESACCCERDCGISCSGNGSTTYPATTTMPLPPVPTPTATPVNSSCYMTSSIYKEPCCVDHTLPQGYCYTGSVCQDGMCVDQQAACYMTTSVYGQPCCVDAGIPPGYCYQGSSCQSGVCV